MYLMYVDESGDCGLPKDGSPTRYFCLTGLVVHELRWRDTMADLIQFRHWIKWKYKINLDIEIHAAEMINKPSKIHGSLGQLKKYERLSILRHFTNKIANLHDISVINIVIDKSSNRIHSRDEVFRRAWYSLFQRFENTIRYQNFPGPKNTDERGMVFPDSTDAVKLRQYLRTMRINNPLKVSYPSGAFDYKDEPIRVIIEDPIMRDSRESYFIQAADCVCFLLKQSIEPCSFMKKHGGNAYFQRLDPVLCKFACRKDPQGIVRL